MKQITVISVPVTDQEKAKVFYTEVVGFELIADNSFGDEMRWIQVGPKGSAASLTLVDWFDDMTPGSLRGLVIETDDLEADYVTMSQRGVPFDGPPSRQPGGVFATLSDPDGNRISLRQAGGRTGREERLMSGR